MIKYFTFRMRLCVRTWDKILAFYNKGKILTRDDTFFLFITDHEPMTISENYMILN